MRKKKRGIEYKHGEGKWREERDLHFVVPCRLCLLGCSKEVLLLLNVATAELSFIITGSCTTIL